MAFAKAYSYDRGMIAAALLTGVGILLDLRLLAEYVGNGYRLLDISYYGVFGLFLIIMGFQTFTFTLSIEMMKRFSRV
jgi:hypothetical protein